MKSFHLIKWLLVFLLSFCEFSIAQNPKPLSIKFVSAEKSIVDVSRGDVKNSIRLSVNNTTQYPKIFNIKFTNSSSKDVIVESQILIDPYSIKTQILKVVDGKELENKFSWSYSERVGDEKSAFLEISNNGKFHHSIRINIFNNDSEVIAGQLYLQVRPEVASVVKVDALNGASFTNSLRYVFNSRHGVFKPTNFNKKIQFPFFETTKVSVCQSFDGKLTTHIDDPMAFDFCGREGESIRAVADGLVYTVIDTFSDGGHKPELKDKANLIGIMDEYGVVYLYVHIVKGSAKVKVGDKVKAGQVIGEVGSVGYSSGPHLHLSVAIVDENINHKSMHVEFLNSKNKVIDIKYKSTIYDGKVR